MGMTHSTPKSFVYAFQGIATAFREEPNFKIHTIITILVVALGFILKLSSIEWLILVLTICMVLVLELINTTLESIVNIISPQVHPEAKTAKDVASSAVLIASIASVIIGILLFAPKVLSYIL